MKNLLTACCVLSTLFTPILLRDFPQLPSEASYFPDLVLALVGAAAILRLISNRRWMDIPISYCLVFLGFVYVAVASAILNGVSGDTIFAGIRTYFRYVPLFLLPFAFRFTEKDVALQVAIVGAALLFQVPVAIWQRFFEFASLTTGDEVRGTMGTTSAIAMLGSGAVLILAAYFLRKQVGLFLFLACSVILLIPAAIGETKVTPILLIIGGGALLVVSRKFLDPAKVAGMVAGTVVLMVVFVTAFNQLYSGDGLGFVEKMTSREYILDNYNLKGITANDMRIGRQESSSLIGVPEELKEEPVRVGRFDSVYLPLAALFPHEISHVFLGLGIGNVSSDFGSGGQYLRVNNELGASQTTISLLLWETGVLGTAFFSAFLFMVLVDSYLLGRLESPIASFASGFFAVTTIFLVCLLYTNLLNVKEATTLFFFFAGIIVAARVKLRQTSRTSPQEANMREVSAYTLG